MKILLVVPPKTWAMMLPLFTSILMLAEVWAAGLVAVAGTDAATVTR
jgi:hypothetical protein